MRKLPLILFITVSSLFLFNCQGDPSDTDPVTEVSEESGQEQINPDQPENPESEDNEDEDCKATDPTCVG